MKSPSSATRTRSVSRRHFLQASGAAMLAASVPHGIAQVRQPSDATLRVGLIGCGGRGTGAAAHALAADPNVKLTAMGDVFRDRLESSLETLKKEAKPSQLDLSEQRQFVGFDAYEGVIANADVVLLATPPHFRPIHLRAAVAAGKHVFAEKPVAVDAGGVRSVLESCQEARMKGLSIVSGLALRYSNAHREAIERIHRGQIGEVRTLQANDFRGPIWVKPRQPGWTDMEYHMRNWYYFTWLSGDFNVEQHVHMLDLCSWIMQGEYPVKAYGIGGRQVRTGPEYGNIYDHHSVVYEYASGVRLHAYCRQQSGCVNDISVLASGAKGTASLSSRQLSIASDSDWVFSGQRNNSFQAEHDALFASIRNGEPINNGEYMTKTTLMAIMGRMATYTGQAITWDQALNSKEDLSPSSYSWDATPPESKVAIPGLTKFA